MQAETAAQYEIGTVLIHWEAVVADFLQFYGVDLADPGLYRSWSWLIGLVVQIVVWPGSRLNRIVFKEQYEGR